MIGSWPLAVMILLVLFGAVRDCMTGSGQVLSGARRRVASAKQGCRTGHKQDAQQTCHQIFFASWSPVFWIFLLGLRRAAIVPSTVGMWAE
jgi:hypothetical protein